MPPPVADKAPEILRSIKPWAAPTVKFLSEDGPNGLSRGIRRGGQMGVFQQPVKRKGPKEGPFFFSTYLRPYLRVTLEDREPSLSAFLLPLPQW